jgi:tight adherence protein C
MTGLFWLIATASFATVAFLTYGVLSYLNNRKVVRDRFKQPSTESMPLIYRGEGNSVKKQFLDWISSLGHYAVDEKKDDSQLRLNLVQAGFRHPKGPAIFFGIRFLLALLLPVIFILANVINGSFTRQNLMFCVMAAGSGFYIVPYLLKFIISRRQDRIDRGLPDVLDLLIVCMEAGLSLQATINRVAEEVKSISVELYRELQLTNAELRTGISREAALKNLGERTGVQNVKALVGLMIQSDRMGASIVQALRTHASFLRVQRSQRAEEHAAKLPVKILFPLLLFIFPAIFVVVLGPAIIQVTKSSLFSH